VTPEANKTLHQSMRRKIEFTSLKGGPHS